MVDQGDIIKLSFDPQLGSEQKGSRPALVVSNHKYHRIFKNRAWVCPITRTDKDYPTQIRLDNRTKTSGVVLCDQLKTVDLAARGYELIENAPSDILDEVLDIIAEFINA